MRPLLPAIAVALASGILPGCGQKLRLETVGGVQLALPLWPEHGRLVASDDGYLDKRDGRGNRAAVFWDIDARPGAPSLDEARDAAAMPEAAQEAALTIDGHPALLLRSERGAALCGAAVVWRCERTARLLRVLVEGPSAPEVKSLAARVRCHSVAATGKGEVPTASGAVLGAGWRFGNRARGSVSFLRDQAVLTYFAGQILPGPRDAAAARKAAPAWAAAAGLQGATPSAAEPSAGPQGHPALRVRGTATLDGRAVQWSLLFWRCLQRQRSFAAIVFSQTQAKTKTSADDSALLSARCHG